MKHVDQIVGGVIYSLRKGVGCGVGGDTVPETSCFYF
jgi:hypothetical protein